MSSMLENETDLGNTSDFAVKSHDIGHRKKIGAFYTPLSVSTALSNWGIRTSTDLVLEPCFGGCTFLEAAVSRLNALGNTAPEANLFGCDIDPLAFSYLKTRIKPATIAGHFFQQDFLEYSPEQCSAGKFDLVIGNPPYIRHSNFSAKQRHTVAQAMRTAGAQFHGRANLWAYFVVHALQFLKSDGRLALVLPGSFLHADYSYAIREFVRSKFSHVVAFTLAERLFVTEGTEETTVVLLAEGFGKPALDNEFMVRCVENTDELTSLIVDWPAGISAKEMAFPGHGLVPSDVGELHQNLASLPDMRLLREMANVRIGLVTGDTPYFVKSRSEWRQLKIDSRHLKYIMPRSQYVPGIAVSLNDSRQHIENDIRCLALWTPSAPRSEILLEYLATYPMAKREQNSTFRRRPIWHQFRDAHGAPDAFFVFMVDQGPRIILNPAEADSTNSMYRIFFNSDVSLTQMKLVALSTYTTFTQLAAEIIGYPRGSGALKLEPSSTLKLALFLPTNRNSTAIDEVFKMVDGKLRQGDTAGARSIADAFLFNEGKLKAALPFLRAGLQIVRSRRMR
jgi:adenine-specific DNA-methyltransferase